MCYVLTVLVGYDNLFKAMFVCLEQFNKLTARPEFPLQCLFKLHVNKLFAPPPPLVTSADNNSKQFGPRSG